MLADQQGQVLNCWGDKRFIDTSRQYSLSEGTNWSELNNGTNAIGTALATGQAVQIQRDEHYLKSNRFMIGSAAPIYDTNNELMYDLVFQKALVGCQTEQSDRHTLVQFCQQKLRPLTDHGLHKPS